uniref:NADH-ubiquinone oxidoreductase chain 4 n=1 Tax=Acizzia uncatoides TaxID=121830 RepID=A0A344A216_ACIUN|nr:NADH dehydrogenase subunit 4 [Acizzia uncatoides]AWU48807.1 NADH dehydrogenase subunit 4 [Acizzia uncatoides]
MLDILLGFWAVAVLMHWSLISYFLMIIFCISILDSTEGGELSVKLTFFMLSIWLTLMMMLSVDLNLKSKELLFIFMFMLLFLMMAFYSDSMFMFYVSFEMSVIPILFVILGWGYQPDRVEAGIYMLSYTVFFSLPLLVKIMTMEYGNVEVMFIGYLSFIMAFLVKIPMVGFHYWLPRAHVEAPVFGSMILAGVMLKLGGYGIFKVALIIGDSMLDYNLFIIILSVMGGVFLSGVCFVQSDLKMLVAYSSVVHMSLVLGGVLTLSELGLNGAIYMMVGHGFCSSGLFCVLGLTYKRSLTRSMILNKGFLSVIPICSLWWFLFCSSNLSFPPSLNLAGELFLFIAILSSCSYMFFFMGVLGVLSSMYSIYLFSFTQQSSLINFYSFKSFSVMESLLLLLHWIPLNGLILNLSIVSFF